MSLNDRIRWNCSGCGQLFKSPPQNAGKQVVCTCGLELMIPVPDQSVGTLKNPPAEIRSEPVQLAGDRILWNCPECDQRYKTPARMAGKNITCTTCTTRIQVPTPEVPETEPERLRWACGGCDLTFQTTTALAGQIIECPSCQAAIPVPDGSE